MYQQQILSEKPASSHRGARKGWLAAAVALPMMITFGAYGVAEFGPQQAVAVVPVTESLPSPDLAARITDTPFWREETIRSGDTLGALIAKLGVDDDAAKQFIRTDPAAKPLYELHSGRVIRAQTTPDGRLLQLRYVTGAGSEITVRPSGTGFSVNEAPAELLRESEFRSGTITSSLFAATDRVGLPDEVTRQLVEIFEGEIDFHRRLQKGDRFGVVYETFSLDGQTVRTGRILAAEFVNAGRKLSAVWHETRPGEGAYYSLKGESLKKSFLQTPVEFSRISSGFSMRFHPILKEWRAHKGIDYAAPTGTRIRAAADGVITFAGRKGAYGNAVEIKHHGAYSTLYGHLNGFAAGIRNGQHVRQGDIIGFVGSTGRATGPHLHYEFKIAGNQVDPSKLNLPKSHTLDARQFARFRDQMQPLQGRLELMARIDLARAR
ncbi:peptidoglycan DD-metalloendopeptidase family protein [Chitiniphilus purpureus]|uniref:Peptidoglycan DD-metalloendopeptidase family protein n=1 Tax=Chitiniphilus purpureus TaxID=2981137 RepID=A0ABY6DMR5_9NEIS|nr:peptidoglycan DD-metalloendopeptidase family protein [Chitiniphilus sp. CD1]UXY14391.1 peptidoglycan DD-metalloendopeptidase family protein [Chitiniphilus sp. CD1]